MLSESQIDFYIRVFNYVLLNTGQRPLDTNKLTIVQICRFDGSKGYGLVMVAVASGRRSPFCFPPGLEILSPTSFLLSCPPPCPPHTHTRRIPYVIEAFRLLAERMRDDMREDLIPQLVIAGHGAFDDPEANLIFSETMAMVRSQRYRHLALYIKLALLRPKDQILNALTRVASLGLQLSTAEGWEIKITELLMRGIPMIVSNVGGMPCQVRMHCVHTYARARPARAHAHRH